MTASSVVQPHTHPGVQRLIWVLPISRGGQNAKFSPDCGYRSPQIVYDFGNMTCFKPGLRVGYFTQTRKRQAPGVDSHGENSGADQVDSGHGAAYLQCERSGIFHINDRENLSRNIALALGGGSMQNSPLVLHRSGPVRSCSQPRGTLFLAYFVCQSRRPAGIEIAVTQINRGYRMIPQRQLGSCKRRGSAA